MLYLYRVIRYTVRKIEHNGPYKQKKEFNPLLPKSDQQPTSPNNANG